MDSETRLDVERTKRKRGKYSNLEKLVARGKAAKDKGDHATVQEINELLHETLRKAGINIQNLSPSQPSNESQRGDDLKPISDESMQIEETTSNVWYVAPDGSKKRAKEGIIPTFPPVNQIDKTEVRTILESDNVLVDNPIQFSEKQWLDSIHQIPNFEGNINNAANFMYNLAYGILDVRNKQSEKRTNKEYLVPSIALYYGKNKNSVGIYYDNSRNQIVVSSDYLSQYSQYGKFDKVILRTDIKGNDVVFDGRIANWASLIGIEEATHAVSNQRERITGILDERIKVSSLAEYDADDEEYEALLVQLDFAKREKMDQDTIRVIKIRIGNAQLVRKKQNKRY